VAVVRRPLLYKLELIEIKFAVSIPKIILTFLYQVNLIFRYFKFVFCNGPHD